jgi:hypothetical protein
VNTLALTLASCKRQEDKLGPSQVLDTVIAQHQLLHRLQGGCPPSLCKPLFLVDSNMACTIGWYLIEMGHHDAGRRYLEHARKAGHDAGNPACAAYSICDISNAASLRGDTPNALDASAAARSLATRRRARQRADAERSPAEKDAMRAAAAIRNRGGSRCPARHARTAERPALTPVTGVIFCGVSIISGARHRHLQHFATGGYTRVSGWEWGLPVPHVSSRRLGRCSVVSPSSTVERPRCG